MLMCIQNGNGIARLNMTNAWLYPPTIRVEVDRHFLTCHVSNKKHQAEKAANAYYFGKETLMFPRSVVKSIPTTVKIEVNIIIVW